jgi:hypothetical protein
MKEFTQDTFKKQYSARPLVFEKAESTHFTCKYCYRDSNTIYQFFPKIVPTRKDFISKIQELLPSIIGDERAEKCTVDHIVDERIEGGESICLVIPGFTNKTFDSSRRLATKLLTDFHNALS